MFPLYLTSSGVYSQSSWSAVVNSRKLTVFEAYNLVSRGSALTQDRALLFSLHSVFECVCVCVCVCVCARESTRASSGMLMHVHVYAWSCILSYTIVQVFDLDR